MHFLEKLGFGQTEAPYTWVHERAPITLVEKGLYCSMIYKFDNDLVSHLLICPRLDEHEIRMALLEMRNVFNTWELGKNESKKLH